MAQRRFGSNQSPWPLICQGDWFITKGTTRNRFGNQRPQCYEYVLKPEDGWGLPASELKVSLEPLPCSTYIGPVHGEPEQYNGYVTVRVPSFWEPHRLVWVNVSKGNIAFADKVADAEVRRWEAKGWVTSIRPDPGR